MRKSVVWGTYVSILIAGLLALGWLSVESVRLDHAREVALEETERARRAELIAKQQIEMQDRISRAVWLLDSNLTPLIAQEATRPADAFQPLVQPSIARRGKGGGGRTWEPSPLLELPSEYIRLHFQVGSNDVWTSPQVPRGNQFELCSSEGLLSASYNLACDALEDISADNEFKAMVAKLPQEQIDNSANWTIAMNPFDYNGPGKVGQNRQTYAYPQDSLRQLNRQQAEFQQVAEQPPTQQVQQAAPQQRQMANANANAEPQGQQLGLQDWNQRNRIYESFANSALVNQQLGMLGELSMEELAPLGVTRPLWLGHRLILARQTILPSKEIVVQGCWLDWDRLQQRMKADVAEILPQVEFEPVVEETQLRPSHLLATLPVQLSVPPDAIALVDSSSKSSTSARPIFGTLIAAWIGFAIAAVAGGGLLFNAESLSDRRAQFVSSVTHELRTPLTTFRMYTEMLSSGMVESEEDRQEYLGTLQLEADRLTHLVENVLAYSRLEHGRKKTERVEMPVTEVMDRIGPRLQRQAKQMGCHVDIHCDISPEVRLNTDMIAIEQILSNLVDNACKYGVRPQDPRPFLLEVNAVDDRVVFRMCDHGPGIPVHKRSTVFHPFCKSDVEAAQTAPGIGLGLALSRRLAQDLGGLLTLDESWTKGACFEFAHPMS